MEDKDIEAVSKQNSSINQIADDYLAKVIELDPVMATYLGIEGHNDSFGNYAPDGCQESNDLVVETLGRIEASVAADRAESIASTAMSERLELEADRFAAGEWKRSLNVIASPLQEIRQVFDLMPTGSDDHWHDISQRLSKVPAALAGYRESLSVGLRESQSASSRQALRCADQAFAYARTTGSPGFFTSLAAKYHSTSSSLATELIENAQSAALAYQEFGEYLNDDYAPKTQASDFIGADRWQLMCRTFNGTEVDAAETYAWGWEEMARIENEMTLCAREIDPSKSLEEVLGDLDGIKGYVIEGEDNFRAWNQELLDSTMDALTGSHFDVPEPVRRIEAMIAPPGGAAAMYYTPPTVDFSRPGRTWYPTMGRTKFPLWTEVSTAYHEGVPGHHMQVAQIYYLGDRLNSFQRLLGSISGYLEGWALYAERLMAELGFLDDPIYRLGMLAAQALRAARVVVDIGLHHQYAIPAQQRRLPAEIWAPELAVGLMHSLSGRELAFAQSEVDRYLGWPAQATSYKIGERIWLETREAARAAQGANFSLKRFHQDGFNLGFVGLGQLREELGH